MSTGSLEREDERNVKDRRRLVERWNGKTQSEREGKKTPL